MVCDKSLDEIDRSTAAWIRKFAKASNKNGSMTIQEACRGHKPYWWSLRPKQANIFTAINPYTRFFFTYSETPVTLGQRLIGFTVKPEQDVRLITALLNSAISLMTIELRGVSRNLGVLDLNANFFKELSFLNPSLLNADQKQEILDAFKPLENRKIDVVFNEVRMADRVNFDKTVLRCFGIDVKLLGAIYELLTETAYNRVTMKERSAESCNYSFSYLGLLSNAHHDGTTQQILASFQ